ncbi:hypothetical protein TRVA0_089S00100 [Trichomonascus vanleenenianus]|uniref:Zn(II)2Cys6 transcription factor n=1 Tax=Trichomonascus vanleenenianus TaxID=2268995 RepID=UPI003ECA15A7
MPKSSKGRHRRSIFACMKCHKSKMKCDIMTHGNPCSRCHAKGYDQCDLFPSKRLPGRENTVPATSKISTRLSSRQRTSRQATPAGEDKEQSEPLSPFSVQVETPKVLSLVPLSGKSSSDGEAAQDADGSSENPAVGNVIKSPIFGFSAIGEHLSVRQGTGFEEQSPDMLLSWSENGNRRSMRVLIDQSETRSTIDKNTLVFVGESSPLSFLVRHQKDSGHVTMSNISQVKVPRASSLVSPSSASSLESSTGSVVFSLQSGVLDALVTSYFHAVHPFYPVINRQWFAEKYAANDVPLLLLNAVCFAACYHCEQFVVYRAGYSSREEAKEAFYAEAKRLFDEEQEEDILIILQTAVLLSFYGGKPRRVWNNRSWLAIAVTIAEDLGLHRSTARMKMDEADKNHLRVIWWCIVFRDFMTSLNFGRPQKTCDSRSDFELLSLQEFDHDLDPSDRRFGKRDIANCHFLVQNAKLNMLMMKVFNARYLPHSDPQANPTEHYAELMEWKNNLPKCLDWTENPSSLAAIYACMVYNHMIIFIYRPRMADSETLEMCSLEQAVKAASEIASMVGKLGVIGTIQIPQDMYSIIVTAMAILMNDVQSNGSVSSKLQLQICFMTLTQAKENWDHAPWIVKFFERMLNDSQDEQCDQGAAQLSEEPLLPDDIDFLKTMFSPMDSFLL